MGKYLKLFNQDAEYHLFKESEEYILPNVSFIVESNSIAYNPFTETKSGVIMARYNATEDNNRVVSDISNIKSLKINGENVVFDWDYCFSEIGEYDVEIELIDTTFIESETFYGTCLTSINIPDSVTTIGSDAFGDCTSLPVEDNIRYADTYLVGAVDKSLSTYTIKEGTKWIGEAAFYGCSSLTSIVIPDSVTSIGHMAFCECKGLTGELVIPDSVTTIGNTTFYGCSGLTSIVIPNSVTSIGNQAFDNCSGLTSVEIGSGVTSIETSAFSYCSGLTSITCNAIIAPSITFNTFYGVKEGGVLKVPAGSDYSSWMSTNDCYLGKYNWTIEYI